MSNHEKNAKINSILFDESKWCLTDNEYRSVRSMSQEQIKSALIHDVGYLTLLEQEVRTEINFTTDTLLRFIHSSNLRNVIRTVLGGGDMMKCFNVVDGQIRMNDKIDPFAKH